jgi:hypothetical protein
MDDTQTTNPGTKSMYRIVGKFRSDSLFTVLPKTFAASLKIEQGDLLRFRRDSDRIIIQKVE